MQLRLAVALTSLAHANGNRFQDYDGHLRANRGEDLVPANWSPGDRHISDGVGNGLPIFLAYRP